MGTVGAREARTHFSRLLERVAKGERITITKRGRPVAVLQPLETASEVPVRDIIARLRQIRRSNRLDGLTIRELIEEGRQ